jgi:adenylosuccinate synthase
MKIFSKKARLQRQAERFGQGYIDVLVGLQWGDEGKGKNIDELLSSGNYSAVARFQGGANAGHTLKCGEMNFIGHIIPSGCLQKGIELYIGNEVVVDVISLIKEIGELKILGFDVADRLFISNRAKLVSYLHPFLDQAEEFYRNKDGAKIGTTARGIGPAYSDSRARRGLLVGDILLSDFEKKEANLSQLHLNFLKMYQKEYGFEFSEEKIKEARDKWFEAIGEIKKLKICDLSHLVQKKLAEGKNILAEGAQGIMLDLDYGDYPNVTSSNTLPANVCLGLGVPHTVIRNIYGVIKAYTTKVGEGDFPARIKEENIEKLFQDAGHEFGATTGRPRMCGWLDLVALRYAIGLSGVNKLFINKADICPTEEIKVIIGYESGGKVLEEFPLRLKEVTGVKTETMPGWGNNNYGISEKKKVSDHLATYLNYIKKKLSDFEVEIVSVGTGPDRSHSFNWDKE